MSQQVDPLQKLASFLSDCLQKLQKRCSEVYPNHSTPDACLRPERSFILESGPDPLDYIYVYKNNGQAGVPKHWHYIGMGLSDIHGYSFFCREHEKLREQNPEFARNSAPMINNIYPPPVGPKPVSGFGFELSMRVKCNSKADWQADPPTWPRKIMQDLARYVFQSRNVFHVGDHVAWHSPLDSAENGPDSSRIEHVLMTLDPQLGEVETSSGLVKFIQIVGVCNEELEAAREWNVRGVLEMMKEREEMGGHFLVTDMRRGQTIFEMDPNNYDRLEREIRRMGSDMAQISARHKTSYTLPDWFTRAEQRNHAGGHHEQPVRQAAIRPSDSEQAVGEDEERAARPASRMSLGSESGLCIENIDLSDTRYFNSIYLLLSHESARVLPVMMNGRLAHKRHFSFQSFKGDSLVTFIPEGCHMKSLVEPPGKPYARRGPWLQIYVPEELRKQMSETIMPDFSRDNNRSQDGDEDEPMGLSLPRNYSWPDFNIHLTIVDEIPDDY